MSLKNEIEKTMFKEGIDDRIQDIATFVDISVEDVNKRLKTLTFSDYIEKSILKAGKNISKEKKKLLYEFGISLMNRNI